jgi:acetylornithine deacetylase/succinyl-diaminopimelate desuccinylase-like protein
MRADRTSDYIDAAWDRSIVPELVEYIRIPNKSPAFDPDWQAHGYMDEAVARFVAFAKAQPIAGLAIEVERLPERTPLILIDIPPTGAPGAATVLLYGHLDKQPEMSGWRAGLGPWLPVLEGDRLYGRGAADDGYAMFAALCAIAALEREGTPHARCVVIIEACEESGSFDLPPYIEALAARIGEPDLVICLDSGCGNYEQLWCTTSLRGLAGGTLKVEVLSEGVHSGDAGGIVPSSFRIMRQLLGRLEDAGSGAILPPAFHAEIPPRRLEEARLAAEVLGREVYAKFPLAGRTRPISDDPAELILNRTWRPALSVVGAEGLPPARNAGNVQRPYTTLKLSLRLPPSCDARLAADRLEALFESDPPYGAEVSFDPDWAASGWDAPALAPWLAEAVEAASGRYFGRPAVYMGEGGSIPFMGMLAARYPRAQFLITGVLGPGANAHGPNEFLHLPTAKRLTGCVAHVIAEHRRQRGA